MKVVKQREYQHQAKLNCNTSAQNNVAIQQSNLRNSQESHTNPEKEFKAVTSMSSFSKKLSRFLRYYQEKLENDEPWFFTSITERTNTWERRKNQVAKLLGYLEGNSHSFNDGHLVELCVEIANEPWGVFNRMELPTKLKELLKEFTVGKVGFNFNYIQTNGEASDKCNELITKLETVATELETEKMKNSHLISLNTDLDNIIDDKITQLEFKKDDFKQVWSYINSRSQRISIQTYDRLVMQYRKLEEKNRNCELKLTNLENSYAKVCLELAEQNKKLTLLTLYQNGQDSDGNNPEEINLNQIAEDMLKKDMVIQDLKNQIGYRNKVVVARYRINEALKKELKQTQERLDLVAKEKEEEIKRLSEKLVRQEAKIRVLTLLVPKLLQDIKNGKQAAMDDNNANIHSNSSEATIVPSL